MMNLLAAQKAAYFIVGICVSIYAIVVEEAMAKNDETPNTRRVRRLDFKATRLAMFFSLSTAILQFVLPDSSHSTVLTILAINCRNILAYLTTVHFLTARLRASNDARKRTILEAEEVEYAVEGVPDIRQPGHRQPTWHRGKA